MTGMRTASSAHQGSLGLAAAADWANASETSSCGFGIDKADSEKRGRPGGRPKSREETPKVGCNIDTQHSMLQRTIYVALHNNTRVRSSQARTCTTEQAFSGGPMGRAVWASRSQSPSAERPGTRPGL